MSAAIAWSSTLRMAPTPAHHHDGVHNKIHDAQGQQCLPAAPDLPTSQVTVLVSDVADGPVIAHRQPTEPAVSQAPAIGDGGQTDGCKHPQQDAQQAGKAHRTQVPQRSGNNLIIRHRNTSLTLFRV